MSFTNMKTSSIGTKAVLFIAILFFTSYFFEREYPLIKPLKVILLGGFIGGLTNAIAIKMLFRKYWYFPGSGIILKNRIQIINSLAESIETHILNIELVQEKLKNLIDRVNTDKIKNTLNMVIDEFRDDILQHINSRAIHAKVVAILKENLGTTGKILNFTGIKDYDTLAHQILDYFDNYIETFIITDSMIGNAMEKTGSLEDFFLKKDNRLLIKHYNTHEPLAFLLLKNFNAKQTVINKLSQYPADKIRDIIEANMKEHLSWLEIFGILLGMGFSALFLLLP
jgi:uncharacterized membrane protein YheB (UPF0754 family)